MKKYIVGFVASLVFVGCGGGGGESSNTSGSSDVQTSTKVKTIDNSEAVNMPNLDGVSSPTDNLAVK